MKRALSHESVDLTWSRPAHEDVAFSATKNPPSRRWDREDERVKRNDGHSTACELVAVVSAADGFLHADDLPDQGDDFVDGAGNHYRVARRDYTPGLPQIVFHVPEVTALA
jgi:hypothetical protein